MLPIKKPYHPLYIANYIISFCEKEGYELNNLKLQKIMYFLQAQSLLESETPLFEGSLQKWKYGPVVPSVYHEYKSHGAANIKTENIGRIIRTPVEGEEPNFMGMYVIEDYDENKIDIGDRHTLIYTIPLLSTYDPFVLVDKTHEHKIWKDDAEKILNGVQNISYTNEEIREFFSNHPEEQLWKV